MSNKQMIQRIHCLEMWIEILTGMPGAESRIAEYQLEIDLLRMELSK